MFPRKVAATSISSIKSTARLIAAAIIAVFTAVPATAQRIDIPAHVAMAHPRLATMPGNSQSEIRELVRKDAAAKSAVDKAESDLAPLMEHVNADPMWLASRLQMYWTTHATEIYNAGDNFDHAGGQRASAVASLKPEIAYTTIPASGYLGLWPHRY